MWCGVAEGRDQTLPLKGFCIYKPPFIVAQLLSYVQLFEIPQTTARQAPLLVGFSRQEYWSGLPFPSLEDPPGSGIKSVSPPLAGGFFTTEPPGKSYKPAYFNPNHTEGSSLCIEKSQVENLSCFHPMHHHYKTGYVSIGRWRRENKTDLLAPKEMEGHKQQEQPPGNMTHTTSFLQLWYGNHHRPMLNSPWEVPRGPAEPARVLHPLTVSTLLPAQVSQRHSSRSIICKPGLKKSGHAFMNKNCLFFFFFFLEFTRSLKVLSLPGDPGSLEDS